MKQFCLFFLLLFLSVEMYAQSDFHGQVVGGGKPLQSVSVMLLDGRGKILKFAKTDTQGRFSIRPPEGKTVEKLSFVCVGYARQSLALGKFKQGMAVEMKEQVQQIREVKVTPKDYDMRGDTIGYSVTKLRQKQDRTIEDVIGRIPGIQINVYGDITYQGIPINRFYVDGKNSLGGDYKMLSKNLSADKVDSVQLLRNHQPIKSLQGKKFSDAAAINIVLDANAKNVWTGTAEVGSGLTLQKPIDWVRRARLVEMFLNHHVQVVALYKHNNLGESLLGELGGAMFSGTYESGFLRNIGGVGEGRQGFNNSHLAAANLYKSLGDNEDLRIIMSGFMDKSTASDYSESVYIDDANSSRVVEQRQSRSYKSEWKGAVCYTKNSRSVYFTEMLNGILVADHSEAVTSLNGRKLQEYVKPHKQGVSNTVSFNLPTSHDYRLSGASNISFTRLPGGLLLYNGTNETANLWTWMANNTVNLGKTLGRGFDASFSLDHNLDFKKEYVNYNDTVQRACFRRNTVGMSAVIAFNNRNLHASIGNNLKWLYNSFDDIKDIRWVYTPSVDMTWNGGVCSSARVNYSHGFSQTGFYEVNPLRIYTSYNAANSGTGKFDNTAGDHLSASYSHSSPGKGWSYGVMYSFDQTHFSHLYESNVYNGIYVRSNVATDNKTTNHGISGDAGYRFRKMGTNVSLDGSYQVSDFDIMRSGVKMASGMRMLSLGLSVKMRPCKWFYFEEHSSFSQTRQKSVADNADDPAYRSFFHTLKLYFQPGKWQLKMTNSCSHSKDGSVNFNIYSDAEFSYKTKTYELLLSCRNLWGENKSEIHSISALGSFYTVTQYRPREIVASLSFSL